MSTLSLGLLRKACHSLSAHVTSLSYYYMDHSHRHPETHACSPSTSSSQPLSNEAGKALLAKHFPNVRAARTPISISKRRKLPTDPKKRAQVLKVELMKVRHTAIPADRNDTRAQSVLVQDRLHARITMEGVEGKEKCFWFRKVSICLRTS